MHMCTSRGTCVQAPLHNPTHVHWNSHPHMRPASPALDERLNEVRFFDGGVPAAVRSRGDGHPHPQSSLQHAGHRGGYVCGGGADTDGHMGLGGHPAAARGPAWCDDEYAGPSAGYGGRGSAVPGTMHDSARGSASARGGSMRRCSDEGDFGGADAARMGTARPYSAAAGARGYPGARSVGIQDEGLTGQMAGMVGGGLRRGVDRDTQTAESCMRSPAEVAAAAELERAHGIAFRQGVLPKPVW